MLLKTTPFDKVIKIGCTLKKVCFFEIFICYFSQNIEPLLREPSIDILRM